MCWPALSQANQPTAELTLNLRTMLGSDPLAGILLVRPGHWGGLTPVVASPPGKPTRRRVAEATVEVWDLAPPEWGRAATFSLYMDTLRRSLTKAWEAPPPSHQAIELAEIMLSDPSNPQKLDLTRVQSMQERFNRLPPNGSPVK
jgi:hypothetical protein